MATFKKIEVVEPKVIAVMEIVKEKAAIPVPAEAIIAATMKKTIEHQFETVAFFSAHEEKLLEEATEPEELIQIFFEMAEHFTSFCCPSSKEILEMAAKMEVVSE